MSLLLRRLGSVVLLLHLPATSHAGEGPEIWDSRISRVWMDDHVAVARPIGLTRPAYRLARTQMWANGIARSDMRVFSAADLDRTIGAKLRPFHDLDFAIGTELTRSAGESGFLSSRASWEAAWERDWKSFGGLNLGLTMAGSLGSPEAGYFQSLTGTLGIPLNWVADMWRTELRLSPSMGLDTSNGAVGTGLTSELIGQRVLSSHADAFKSILRVRVGYGVAPGERPLASAKLEISISPNL